MIYTAVIGDLVHSREISDRTDFQREFKKILMEVNERWKDEIASSFIVTLGDEFQGLLKRRDCLYEIILYIRLRISPVSVRFGCGTGEITTDIDPSMSLGADGPAYHLARRMLDSVRNAENSIRYSGETMLISTEGSLDEKDMLINSISTLLSSIERRWTEKQMDNILDMHFHGMSQGDIAMKKNVNQSTVNRSLGSSDYYCYLKGLETMNRLLKERGE